MSKCFKVAGFTACLAAVLVMSGGHWFALQAVAWGRMMAAFSRQDPLGTAVAKTFSGKHPCTLCLKVQQGWQAEKQREEKLPSLKIDRLPEALWGLRCVTIPAPPTAARDEQPFVPGQHSDFVDSPPSPPPRVCLATL